MEEENKGKELNLGEDRVHMKTGIYFSRIKVKKNENLNEDISNLLKNVIQDINYDVNKELGIKKIAINMSFINGIVDLNESSCIVMLSGSEVEILTPYEKIFKTWTTWKLKQ